MGRTAEGHTVYWKRGRGYVRFTFNRRRYQIALDTTDEREAATRAARAYSDVVSGRVAPSPIKPGTLRGLNELWDEWVEWKRPGLDETTVVTLGYYGDRFVDAFVSLDRITKATIATYTQARLSQVTRRTVGKERCYLGQFLIWCEEHGALASAPAMPRIPPKATGKRSGKQRQTAVEVSPVEVQRILAKMPAESKRIGGRAWPIRDRFVFAYETALRPATVSRISVPENWRPGSKELVLTNEDDKARYGRVLDLTPAAVRILRKLAPTSGLVFGPRDFRVWLKRAAGAVLDAPRAKDFAAYDFRHGRARHMLDDGATIRGVAYVLGHRHASTTDKYLAPDRRAGKAAMRA